MSIAIMDEKAALGFEAWLEQEKGLIRHEGALGVFQHERFDSNLRQHPVIVYYREGFTGPVYTIADRDEDLLNEYTRSGWVPKPGIAAGEVSGALPWEKPEEMTSGKITASDTFDAKILRLMVTLCLENALESLGDDADKFKLIVEVEVGKLLEVSWKAKKL